jgi:hypothetical protein
MGCCLPFICAGSRRATSRRRSPPCWAKTLRTCRLPSSRDCATNGRRTARWQRGDLSARRYVYVWADGICLQARMEPQAECMLVLIGATPEGKKKLLGFQVGMRESAQSWRELLVDLKARGLIIAPSWPPATARLASGKRSRRCHRPPGTSAAPCTRPPTWRQDAQVHPTGGRGGPAPDLGGAGPRDGDHGDHDVCRESMDPYTRRPPPA